MPNQILIATPHAAFGELLRISLEETGDYRVRLVQSGREVQASLARLSFDLVLLDADLTDMPLAEVARQVLVLRGPRLMVVPPDNNPRHPMLAGIEIHGFVYRPFYTPDLLESIAGLMRTKEAPAPPPAPEMEAPPDWLENPALAEQHLQNALVGCTAHLVIITRGGQVLVAFGSLDRPAAQEIANILLRSTPGGLKNDLARYFRLSNIAMDYILYARALAGEARLALVYEVSTPLTRIRSQMNTIIKGLAQPPAAPTPEKVETPAADPFEWAVESAEESSDGISDTEMANLTAWLADLPSPDPDPYPAEQADSPQEPAEPSSAADLGWIPPQPNAPLDPPPSAPHLKADSAPLGNAPSHPPAEPLPEVQEAPPLWRVAPPELPQAVEVISPTAPRDLPPDLAAGFAEEIGQDASPMGTALPDMEAEANGEPAPAQEPLLFTGTPAAPGLAEPYNGERAIELVDPTAETRPIALRRSATLNLLETASPAFAALAYAACLIPRLPSHYLNGEIAAQLAAWLPEVCLAFGWRLLSLQVRPDTLQWVVQLSPTIPPAQMIRAVRHILSQRLFDHDTRLVLENPSGDFWAPGYLVISGSQMPTPDLVRMFVTQTRRQQGLQID